MSARYFAYGSNLTLDRMTGRVTEARALGIAWLADHRLTWDKRGADGSGKANLRREAGSRVWGVVYAFAAERWPELDAHEPDYARIRVEVQLGDASLPAETYLSTLLTSAPPLAGYKRLVVEGARAHGLPDAWLRDLAASTERPDRD